MRGNKSEWTGNDRTFQKETESNTRKRTTGQRDFPRGVRHHSDPVARYGANHSNYEPHYTRIFSNEKREDAAATAQEAVDRSDVMRVVDNENVHGLPKHPGTCTLLRAFRYAFSTGSYGWSCYQGKLIYLCTMHSTARRPSRKRASLTLLTLWT